MSEQETEPTEDAVREALRTVSAPDGDGDVIAAGLVASVTVADGTVSVETALSGMDPATADALADRMRAAVLECSGVEQVRVNTDVAAPDHGTVVPGVDRIIVVASAKGGVGKTTVSTQLARGLAASGERVGLFDADVYGPNTPELLGIEGPLDSTDDGRAEPIEVDGLQVVSVGLIANDEPMAWRGAMAHEAVEELLTDAAWDVDTLVLDLPPGTGDIVLTTLQSFPVDGAVFVTTPFPTAASDTERSTALFREEGIPILGAVVNMAGFTCPTCGDEHAPFGSDPDISTDVLAELPIDESLRSTEGDVPAAFRDLGDDVREALPDNETVSVPETALDLRGVPDQARIEQVRVEFDALAPGESLHLLTDTRPGDVRGVLEDLTSVPLRVATDRKGPGLWALQLSKADPDGTEEVTC
ncbi:ATP-binding protein [Haloarcula mannanilytica]|uniref:Iron-sulfur cluster carrier protein n=1 Tax=Haloarcula mannanilytica TaxID=2509225 RepID=A0A4C2ELM8_9EURY|nr:P-loop NTPase [Haloarcula mannanilytica]GCF15256.1 ATP-binding protein [Haloarcula mannanilytica]